MGKVGHAIIKGILYASAFGLFVDIAILSYLKIQKNAIIHNLEKDILIDKWWEGCTSLLALLIPLIVATGICLLFIYKRKVTNNFAVKNDSELSPTLDKTSYGRRKKQNVIISDDFPNLFMPQFVKGKDELGDNSFIQFKEALQKSDWCITDLGRIARMCFEADVHHKTYKTFKEWMIAFCKALNRLDYPKNPQKKDYKVNDEDFIRQFNCIVKIGKKKHDEYIERLTS